jgi:hypothetical protein
MNYGPYLGDIPLRQLHYFWAGVLGSVLKGTPSTAEENKILTAGFSLL